TAGRPTRGRPAHPSPPTTRGPAMNATTANRPYPAAVFAWLLERFADCDRRAGGWNFVALADLRDACAAWPRPHFDAGLPAARRTGLLTLSGFESSRGLDAAEVTRLTSAAVQDADGLLAYVSRRQ